MISRPGLDGIIKDLSEIKRWIDNNKNLILELGISEQDVRELKAHILKIKAAAYTYKARYYSKRGDFD